MHKKLSLAVLSAAACLALPALADKVDSPRHGDPVAPSGSPRADTPIDYPGGTPPANVSGALSGASPTFNRPLSNCAGLSAVGTSTPYDTITLTNSGASTATLSVRIGDPGDPATCSAIAGDPFLAAYAGSFNPAAPMTNCVAANDDTTGRCPLLTGVSVAPGATLVLVATSFDNGEVFQYEVSFAGTTPVSLQRFSIE